MLSSKSETKSSLNAKSEVLAEIPQRWEAPNTPQEKNVLFVK
jgi:hypothetical protein